jgi:radical SAM superfamily enzyme YgiQ (UPF0313 family)
VRVLLIGADVEENLATRYLAAAVEAGGHVADIGEFSDHDDRASVLAKIRAFRPDVVGLSMTFQRRAHEFGELAVAIREDGYEGHMVAGGHFPTFAWREVLESYPAIDTVVRHEGEQTLRELCDAIAAGSSPTAGPRATPRPRPEALANVRGLVWRATGGAVVPNEPRPLCEDLDALPFPKRIGEPQVHMGIPTAFVVGSRGCYGHCAFCCINAYISEAGGSRYRARSADNIADELAMLRRTRGARMFVFHDDDFFTRDRERDLARMKALRDALWARDVRDIALVVKARPDDVDPEVFRVLQEIGLLRVYVGIEAGSSQGLKTLGRGVDLATNERAIARLRELDVYACYNMLLFDPDSTTAGLRESLEFVRRHPEIPMNFCRTEVYVGTPIMRRLARQGRLVGDVFGWDYEIADVAAERSLRLFAYAFLDRNFRCDGLMNATLGLGYHLHLLRRFYPHASTQALRDRTEEVIRKVNLDCVARMNQIFDFADSPASHDPDAFAEFAERLAGEVEAANAALEAEVADATQALLRAARSRPGPAAALWRTVAAATLAMTPVGCKTTFPPPDPPPPPVDATSQVVPEGNRFAEPPGRPSSDDVDAGFVLPPPDPPPPPDPLPPPRPTGTSSKKRPPGPPGPPSDWVPPPPADPPPPPVPPPPDPLPRPHRR